MATVTYDVNYDDERFSQVEADKNSAINQLEATYQGVIGQADKYYQDQIDAAKDYGEQQAANQQAQTDFAIEQIEQQKDKAHKDYVKEQSGAYVDWQKQSNQYGADAEKQAAAGLTATGFSESSQVSMYNTYQNRVSAAREVYSQAVLNYDNAIKDARLQNNAVLAEIAYQALQTQLELSLEGFQYKNSLILDLANKKVEMDQMYYNRWKDVLGQINTENAMAEEVRQFEENQKFQAEQADLDRDFKAKEAELNRKFEEAQAKLDREHDFALLNAKTAAEKAAAEAEHKRKLELLKKELENEKALLKYQKSLQSSSISKSSGGSSSGKKYTNKVTAAINKTSSSGSGVTIDTDSVIALGRGPISSSNLASLVATGQVAATQKGNKIYVQNTGNKNVAAGQAALNKYTWLK